MYKKKWYLSMVVLALSLAVLAAGCSGANSQSASAPQGKDAANAANQQANPASAYEQLVAAAKKEGTVVVYGPPGEHAKSGLTESFEKQYGIKVLFNGGRASEAFAKLKTEHDAGKISGDVMISGANTAMDMYEAGLTRPLRPELKDPETVDDKNWYQGKLQFIDAEGQSVIKLSQIKDSIRINSDLVKDGDIQSAEDLLNPKWKGKIGISDPRVSGSGNQYANFLLHSYGEDFMRKLLIDQQPEITRDLRLLGDNLARGKYAVTIGLDHPTMKGLIQAGVTNIRTLEAPKLMILITGYGNLTLLNGAPHPNAGALYANWLLSKEGQTQVAKALEAAPIRRDVTVPQEVDPSLVPDDKVDYYSTVSLDSIQFVKKNQEFFKQLIK